MKFFDICANLLDSRFTFNKEIDSEEFLEEITNVIQRAKNNGVNYINICCSNLEETEKALSLCKKFDNLYCTIGIHPMSLNDISEDALNEILNKMQMVLDENYYPKGKIICFGEMGLDAARTEYVSLNKQKNFFIEQLLFVNKNRAYGLPLLLHSRETTVPLLECMKDVFGDINNFPRYVVHSFTDSKEDLHILIDHNAFIGLNGCSFKTEINLKTISCLDYDKVLIETDAPWCNIRKSHPGFEIINNCLFSEVKKKKYKMGKEEQRLLYGRVEPCNIKHVFDILCHISKMETNEDKELFNNKIFQTSLDFFFKK